MPSFFVRLLCLVSSPRFLAWLFRPAFKDNKVISSFSTFLRLLLSFFDIPRIISRFSESLAALRIPSLPSAPLLLFLFSDFRASWCSPHRFAGLCFSSLSSFCLLSSVFCLLSSLFLSSFTPSHLLLFLIHLLFSFSSLSHLTFPASFRYSLRLFSFFLFSDFRASWCSPHRFFFLFSCLLFTFFLSSSLFLLFFFS